MELRTQTSRQGSCTTTKCRVFVDFEISDTENLHVVRRVTFKPDWTIPTIAWRKTLCILEAVLAAETLLVFGGRGIRPKEQSPK